MENNKDNGITNMIPKTPATKAEAKAANNNKVESKTVDTTGVTTTKIEYDMYVYGSFKFTESGNIILNLMDGTELLLITKEDEKPDLTQLSGEDLNNAFDAYVNKRVKLAYVNGKVNRRNNTNIAYKYAKPLAERIAAQKEMQKDDQVPEVEKQEQKAVAEALIAASAETK